MRARRSRLPGLVALAAAASAVFAALAVLFPRPHGESRVELDVTPVALDASDPTRSGVGPLRYLGGLCLRSPDPRFGGLSDLRVSPDGLRLLAISDCGWGFTGRLAYGVDGNLAGLTDARLVELTGADGRPLAVGEDDAESLVAGDSLEVGFEGRGKILAYAAEPAFAGPPRRVPTPAGLSACGWNQGLETMADLGDGRRLLVCEGRRGASVTVPAWIGRAGSWAAREYPLLFDRGWAEEPFRPTAATRLPDGDVLVLERRFPPVGARLVRLSGVSLDGRGLLEPHEIARIEAPLTVDNFEGVEARRDAAGRTLVYLVSDDNNCSKTGSSRGSGLQRTLLLLFSLEG
ncbi:MAG TPA: esterase-like activity of phytase family protein [Vicinamibacteria bacterium]|nr:esterase-like activity of phytase family protein [Vicinamibacteria bacterium]